MIKKILPLLCLLPLAFLLGTPAPSQVSAEQVEGWMRELEHEPGVVAF